MPFHVEISSSIRHARVFNLSQADLLAKVVEPWIGGRAVEMGEREWEPQESRLKILEGPAMAPVDLSFGQGWSNAERRSADVTQRVLGEAPAPQLPDSFLIEAPAPEDLAAELVATHGGRSIEWGEAERALDGRDPEVAAVILLRRKPAQQRRQS